MTVYEAAGEENEEGAWKYLGHYRSHFKHITGMLLYSVVIHLGHKRQSNYNLAF